MELAAALRAPASRTRALQLGGLTPFSSLDYPGQLAAVVFVAGCAWRCGYCHNPHLQRREPAPAGGPNWDEVQRWLAGRVGLLDAVVFSGGEPTTDAGLPLAMAQVRALGFKIGLHSAGLYPLRLQAVLPLVDWVGLDVKAPLSQPALHQRITGVAGSHLPVAASLRHLVDAGIDFECRTTAHPAWLDDAALLRLGAELAGAGVTRYAVQLCRDQGAGHRQGPVPAGYPGADTLDWLDARFEHFTLRSG